MPPRSAFARLLLGPVRPALALTLALGALGGHAARAQAAPGEGREGLAELGRFDPRLRGHYAPKGFKVQVVAAEPTIVDPTAMAFADDGTLYVAEWKRDDRVSDTWETLKLPEGGTTKVLRRRKATPDVVKKLLDTDDDGVYDASEVVVDGAEMPAAIFPWKNSLYLTCVGRLERWSDEDGDGKFELKTVLADGFCGAFHHWLSGMVLNADGWLYLTAGDNDNHVVGSDGSRVEVSRCGGVFRCRVDGSSMHLFALGFRNPYRDLAFNATFDPFLADNDNEDGSKFQGVRLINPVEEGDYGWRLRPGASCCQPDFDRGAADGELPGKLPIVANTGRGAPAGLVVYNGVALPDRYRDLAIYPDVFRRLVRGYRMKPKEGSYALDREVTLMTADDDLFRPCQAVVGADGALYVLDWRSSSGGAGRLWGDGKWGRLYRVTWEGDGDGPALPLKENNWARVKGGSDDDVRSMITGRDLGEADRALRELVERRGAVAPAPTRAMLLGLMNDKAMALHARLLGLQGARQLWDDGVERAMVAALDDPEADVRRLAAQALSWEPKQDRPDLVPALVAHLNDPDRRALRDIALALGQHGRAAPSEAAPPLLAWLLAHPGADVVARDAFIRALERLGDAGVEAIARAIRTSRGAERAEAVAVFSALRTEAAARRLPALATLPDLSGAERLALIKLHKDIPLNIPVATQGLADWVVAHPETNAAVKVATLDVCRLAGIRAPALVLRLLDDKDETVQIASARLAAQSSLEGAIEHLSARLLYPATSQRARAEIVLALRAAGPDVFPTIETAFRQFPAETAFRKAALRALAEVDRSRAIPLAEHALGEGPPELHAEAIQILGERPQTALRLGRALLDRKLDRGDLPAVLAAVRRHDSPEHRALLADIEKAAAAAVTAAALKERFARGADPWNGLSVFLRETGSRCSSCHQIEGLGGNVGPALTGVSQALSLDKLIEAILEPSKEIKEGYEAYKVALKDGRLLGGIKVSQDAEALVLRDAGAQESRIPIGSIDEQALDSASLMPEGLARELSPRDLADLLAFLLSKPAQEALRSRRRLDHVLALGPIATDESAPRVPLDRVDPSQEFPGRGGRSVSWVPLDATAEGTLSLGGRSGTPPGRVYLAAEVRSDRPQDAALRFGLVGASRIFLNGAKVAESPGRGARLGADVARLPLRAGWNTLIVAVDRSPEGGDERAVFEIGTARPVEIRATRP
jgi:quinoprotein glucose dehydrogenase